MTKASSPTQEIKHFEELFRIFYESEKPERQWKVGTESEKFAVNKKNLKPIPFEILSEQTQSDNKEHLNNKTRSQQPTIKRILDAFSKDFGWEKKSEYPGGQTIYLVKQNASITLEPSGQIELSGAPFPTIHETHREIQEHIRELKHIERQFEIAWLPLGFHPLAKIQELPWMPKLRYEVMKQYLPTRSPFALDMMQRTCTVQANFDYENEQDAITKFQTALKIQPIVTGLFANSPWIEGKRSPYLCHRSHIWIHMDPDRSGLLPFAWEEDMSYQKYIEWALDVPMFLIRRGSKVIKNTGQTFRAFFENGFEGQKATFEDWETHLNTLFPEVRIKKTLEVRGTDSQKETLTCAFSAFWKGILYDKHAIEKVKTLTKQFQYDAVQKARTSIATQGMQAVLQGKHVFEWAEELLEISKQGLQNISCKNQQGKDETMFLAPIENLITKKQCPAEMLFSETQDPLSPEQIIESAKI